jgi:hypothetical protein
MGKIFISYRRDDAEEAAGRLSDHLVNQFGRENIFMDVDGIDPGRDFRKVIDETLSKCDILLGVIGKNWIDCRDEAGARRLEDPRDFVRMEIANALKRDIPVIPVRVQGASLPKIDQLPDDLKDFGYRNAFELTHERWNSDVQLLTDKLRVYIKDCDPQTRDAAPAISPEPSRTPAQAAPVQAAPAAIIAPPPVAGPKKRSIKKYVKWGLVGFFLLAVLGGLENGDNATVGFSVILVVFFAWDPFKWFGDKS